MSSQTSSGLNTTPFNLSKIRHDIRTPLGALIGLTTILAKTGPLTPQQEQIVATMKTSADDLNEVLETLFAMLAER